MQSTKNKLYRVLIKYFLLLSIISVVLGLSVYAVLTYSSMKSFSFNNLFHSRDKQIQLMEYWFQERVNEITQISLNPVVKEQNFSEIDLLFKERLSKEETGFKSFVVVDKDGNGMLLHNGEKENAGVCVVDRNYFKLALEGKSCISEVITSKLTSKFTVVVTSPVISKKGDIIGAVVGTLNLDRLGEIISSFNLGTSGATYLVDKNGFMVTEARFTPWPAQNGKIDKLSKHGFRIIPEEIARLSSGEKSYGEYSNYRGAKALGAYGALKNYDWGLVVEIEKAEIMKPYIEKIFITILLFFLILVLIIYPLARFFAHKLALPFEKISENVGEFTEICLNNNLKNCLENNAEGPKKGIDFRLAESELLYEEAKVLNKSFYNLYEKVSGLIATLRAQTLYDQLTGLANRRNFFFRGQEIIELARRKSNPCALIYFDIDDFKKIKESYGHDEADQVLVHLANLIGKTTRISDIACRLEGEEFAIILPETDEKGAMQFAERFRECVEKTPVEVNYHSFNITVSVGVSTFKGVSDKLEKSSILFEVLISQADKVKEQAKEKGGNRVMLSLN
jgi:two-component system cell cycle response regulator